METSEILGQPSVKVASDKTQAWVTLVGGQVAPITFQLPSGPVEPFAVAPWAEEGLELPPILKVLRGDFFCCPFGGNEEPYNGEQHPLHGETANAEWTVVQSTDSEVRMGLDLTIRKGHVDKRVWTEPGQTAIYQRHIISGATGPMCFGHHAMLQFVTRGYVSVAPFGYGQVFPGKFEDSATGGYSFLRPGARFHKLNLVPANDGSIADLTQYPARPGYEDLVMVYTDLNQTLGWSAVHFPDEKYIWFALKDPKILTGTVLWHSNGGRYYAPWNGRHRAVLGIEEVTSSFHWGLAGSVAENEANRAGYRTYFDLKPDLPMVITTIMGVAPSDGFEGHVEDIVAGKGGILIHDAKGTEIGVKLNVADLFETTALPA